MKTQTRKQMERRSKVIEAVYETLKLLQDGTIKPTSERSGTLDAEHSAAFRLILDAVYARGGGEVI